jgi:hypothetical protein
MRRTSSFVKKVCVISGFSMLALGTASADAAVISVSDTAPTSYGLANPYNAGNVGTVSGFYDYSNNGSSGGSPTLHGGIGETFTIPSGGLTITSITLKTTSGAGYYGPTNIGTATWSVDIAAISNNSATAPGYTSYDGGTTYQPTKVTSVDDEIATGSSAIQNDYNAGDVTEYVTFTLAHPVVLAGGTQTAYDFSIITDNNVYVPFAVTGANAYTGGDDAVITYNSYNDGSSGLGVNSVDATTNDKAFYFNASFAPIPEPGSLSLLGLGALGLLRRRKHS